MALRSRLLKDPNEVLRVIDNMSSDSELSDENGNDNSEDERYYMSETESDSSTTSISDNNVTIASDTGTESGSDQNNGNIVNILTDITNDPGHSGTDNHVGQSKTALSAAKAMSKAMPKKIVAKPTQSGRPTTGPNSKQRSQIPVQAERVGLDRGRPIQSSPTGQPRGKGIRFFSTFISDIHICKYVFSVKVIWVKILCHAIFVRLDTADRGGSMMGAIMRFFTEKYHLDPVFFI